MLELLSFPFFQRALIIGSILAVLMAMLGVLVVLRNMSFFSDAIGHSALAGIALGILLDINPFLAAIVFTVFVALGISGIRTVSNLSIDTVLGVFFPSSVALGVLLMSVFPGYQTDLINFLFGNILTLTNTDIVLSVLVGLFVIGVMLWMGKGFVAITLDSSLAKAEGIRVQQHELIFLVMLAIVIALAIKFVGIVLVTALLVIPAASAQNISYSLSSMFWISIVISVASVLAGMLTSAVLNSPSGPTIVLTGAVFFAGSLLIKKIR